MKSGTKLALLLVPVFVVAFLFLFQRGPRAAAPEALDLVRGDAARIITAPSVELEEPGNPSLRESSEETNPQFPFDPKDALRIRLESSKVFSFDRVWLKTALDPDWKERSLLAGMELPYVDDELPLDIRAPGHCDYPVKRRIEFALLLVDSYQVLDFSGLEECLPISLGLSLYYPDPFAPPHRRRDAILLEDALLHVAHSPKRNSASSFLGGEYRVHLQTSCSRSLNFEWEPKPGSHTLDVASYVKIPKEKRTSLRVRLDAPFEFDPTQFELTFTSHTMAQNQGGQWYGSAERAVIRILDWGTAEIEEQGSVHPLARDPLRSPAEWMAEEIPFTRQGTLVAKESEGRAFGRWVGTPQPGQTIELTLERGAFLRGRVLTYDTKEPPPGAKLYIAYENRKGTWSSHPRPVDPWESRVDLRLDPRGNFEVSTTLDPPAESGASARPPAELWAVFSAPFFESQWVHVKTVGQEANVGTIQLVRKKPDLVLEGPLQGELSKNSTVLIKRESSPEPIPRASSVKQFRQRGGRLELVLGASGPKLQAALEQDSAETVERGILRNKGTLTPFVNFGSKRECTTLGTREIELDLQLPKGLTSREYPLRLECNWAGFTVGSRQWLTPASFEAGVLSFTVPNDEVEFTLLSKSGKIEERLSVPRNQDKATF